LNHGAACADTYHAEGFEGSAPKPTPPGEHIPPGGVVHFGDRDPGQGRNMLWAMARPMLSSPSHNLPLLYSLSQK